MAAPSGLPLGSTGRHLQTPARWLRPLDSRIEGLGDTPRPLPDGCALWTPAWKYWGTPPDPCQVAAASESCIEVLGDTPQFPCQMAAASGALYRSTGRHLQTPARWQRPMESCIEVLGDTPSSPARWLRPLESCIEVLGDTSDPCQVAAASGVLYGSAGGHLRPLPGGCGLWSPAWKCWGTPQTPARWLRPLDSRLELLGDTPRPLPEGSALWSPASPPPRIASLR